MLQCLWTLWTSHWSCEVFIFKCLKLRIIKSEWSFLGSRLTVAKPIIYGILFVLLCLQFVLFTFWKLHQWKPDMQWAPEHPYPVKLTFYFSLKPWCHLSLNIICPSLDNATEVWSHADNKSNYCSRIIKELVRKDQWWISCHQKPTDIIHNRSKYVQHLRYLKEPGLSQTSPTLLWCSAALGSWELNLADSCWDGWTERPEGDVISGWEITWA